MNRRKTLQIAGQLIGVSALGTLGARLFSAPADDAVFAAIWAMLRSGVFLACRLDPYKNIFFTGYAWINQAADAISGTLIDPHFIWIGDLFSWLILAVLLVLGFFAHRPFCRFVCPYGVLLGLFSSIGLRRRTIDPASCFACTLCTKTCPTQAITADLKKRSVKVSNFHCIQCGRCDETCKSNSLETPSPYPNSRFPNIAKKRTPIPTNDSVKSAPPDVKRGPYSFGKHRSRPSGITSPVKHLQTRRSRFAHILTLRSHFPNINPATIPLFLGLNFSKKQREKE